MYRISKYLFSSVIAVESVTDSSVSGYISLDTARATGAFIAEAPNKCSAGTWVKQVLQYNTQ